MTRRSGDAAVRASWRSGDAADCKSAHPGSIPGEASSSRAPQFTMTDFSTLRPRMVDNQIRTSGVVDHAVLRAFLAVPRELFVEVAEQPFAYADRDAKMSARSPHRAMMPAAQLARLL